MASEKTGRPAIEDIAAFARGELEDSQKVNQIESDEEAMRLVRQIQTDDEFLTRLAGAWSNAPDGSGRGAPPAVDLVPGYRILGELHRGGQGTVFRAIQERTKRVVAVKVMHGGAAAPEKSRIRFAREVELIASMRHPNIVTVFDGGDLPDGGCFVAMEFIRGVPLVRADALDRKVDSQSRTDLIRTKLVQFAQICDAVQYAHLRGIIHRDIKPGNILIDRDGEPKVLDFGVAKVLGIRDAADVTLTGEFVGTFAYAAPEQVSGTSDEIDTRCDIYALGVVLYEMLTGKFPYNITGPMSETIRNITETDPQLPSKVGDGLDRDIDAIVSTAMAKSPDRRYQSAGSLSADVQRYLAGEPIEARRDSTTYLLTKLARRHRGPIAIAGCLILALVGVAIWMSLLYIRAATAEQEAESGLQAALVEADKRASVIELFTDIIAAVRPERGDREAGREPTIREMLDLASGQVVDRADGRPDLIVAIQTALGQSYLSLDLTEEAREQAEDALEIASSVEDGSLPVSDVEELLAWLAIDERNFKESKDRFERSLRIRESTKPIDNPAIAKTLLGLASVQYELREFDQSMQLVNRGIAILTASESDDLSTMVKLLNHKARILSMQRGDLEAAEMIAMTARELCEEKGVDTPLLITPLNNLAMIAKVNRDLDKAEQLQMESLRVCRRFYPPQHKRIAGLLRNLGLIRQDQGRHILAERDLGEAVEIYKARLGGGNHMVLVKALTPHGVSLREIGDHAGARDQAREAVRILRALDSSDPWLQAFALDLEGTSLVELKQYKNALPPLLEAYELIISAGGDNSEQVMNSMLQLAKAYEGLENQEQAEMWRNRLSIAREKAATTNPPTASGL